jgi:hypothetical protein
MDNWHQRMTGWHKASYTHHEENVCVEIGTTTGLVGIRDTKQRRQPDNLRPVLVFRAASFADFLDRVTAQP